MDNEQNMQPDQIDMMDEHELRTELISVLKKLAQSQDKCEAAHAKYRKYENECDYLRDELKKAQQQLTAKDARITELENSVTMHANALSGVKQRAEAAEAKLVEAEDALGVAEKEREHYKDELKEAKALLAYIDKVSPHADSTCVEHGITFTEACKRQMADAARSKEVAS